jgi:hypothetical protein
MKERLTGDALSRRVAEILGFELLVGPKWNNPFLSEWWLKRGEQKVRWDECRPDTDENQATAAVKKWCGDDDARQAQWVYSLNKIIFKHHPAMDYYGIGTASATSKCQALVAAYEALEEKP